MFQLVPGSCDKAGFEHPRLKVSCLCSGARRTLHGLAHLPAPYGNHWRPLLYSSPVLRPFGTVRERNPADSSGNDVGIGINTGDPQSNFSANLVSSSEAAIRVEGEKSEDGGIPAPGDPIPRAHTRTTQEIVGRFGQCAALHEHVNRTDGCDRRAGATVTDRDIDIPRAFDARTDLFVACR